MQQRVLLLVLDSAEKTLIDQWMQSGDLPNLRRLCEDGAYGSLSSLSPVLNAATWPTFTSGVWPGDHGNSHYLMWRPELMTFQRPAPNWLAFDSFWAPLADRGREVIALDIPYSHMSAQPPSSIELRNWGSHYREEHPHTVPPDLIKPITRQFGHEALGPNPGGMKRTKHLLPIREQLLTSVDKQQAVTMYLMRNYPWDLCLLNFGATHRGGHQFWDTSGLLDTPSEAESELLATTIRDVYRACDTAVGKLIQEAGSDVTVLVMSLHGMQANIDLEAILPEMVRRVLGDIPTDTVTQTGLLHRVRERVPEAWRSALKTKFPNALNDWLMAYWRGQLNYDWRTTDAFSPPGDTQGYVRINLQGREAQGIVMPGDEYDQLWRRIHDGLNTFLDADTGQPIVKAISTPAEISPPGERSYLMPDMIVHWSGKPAKDMRAVISPQYGTITWPNPGQAPGGEPGHHGTDGWIIAAGQGITPGAAIPTAHIIDVAPTVYLLLGEAVPPYLAGRPISLP